VEEWRYLVEQYFAADLVDEALAVMRCESLGDPLAYNPASGASGLFQFIPSTWAWASDGAGFAGASPFDPGANVGSAAWLVQRSIDQGKDAWTHWTCKP
jgi:soluble lytic murein transglycosylase-like protein